MVVSSASVISLGLFETDKLAKIVSKTIGISRSILTTKERRAHGLLEGQGQLRFGPMVA